MTNREALKRLKELTGGPRRMTYNNAAKQISKEEGLDFQYLYWLPLNYPGLDPDAHARSSGG